MNIGKTLAVSAVTGMLAGVVGCGGEKAPAAADPKVPTTTDVAPPENKDCCKGKNECKGKGGCAVEGKNECAGQNGCKGQGGCNAHCPQ